MKIEKLIEKDDRKFLLQSIKVSSVIEKYVKVLGLDAEEVAVFKNDIEVFVYVANRYNSFSESFLLYNIDSMRTRLSQLMLQCVRSENFNQRIGEELGMAAPEKTNQLKLSDLSIFQSLLFKTLPR